MFPNMMKYYKLLREHNINVIYSGPVWSDGIESVGGMLKKRMELDSLPLSASMSVFSVFVEQMNNILLYSEDKLQDTTCEHDGAPVSCGVFVVGTKGKSYYLQTGNVVNKKQAELIKARVDHLNTLDKSDLRKFYKEKLRSEDENKDSKGAGIGLIEIARRASSKIDYELEPYDDESLFFTMHVTIG